MYSNFDKFYENPLEYNIESQYINNKDSTIHNILNYIVLEKYDLMDILIENNMFNETNINNMYPTFLLSNNYKSNIYHYSILIYLCQSLTSLLRKR